MSIDPESEEVLSLKQARKLRCLRRDGRQPDLSQLYRWKQQGVRSGVKLETIEVGGRTCTTKEAVLRFIERCTAAASPEPVVYPTARQRQRKVDSDERKLAAAGI